jgi:Tc toxin complex TcA C-terminal TcB-binding domain
MELAYHEHNRREYELPRHISLRQLTPLALLTLKATGRCEVTMPEWLFDLDNPGQYMRRIKTVGLTLPSVNGPYTSVSCTLSLIRSTLRRSSLLQDDQYERKVDGEDTRFVDYFGSVQSIVTSSGNNDSGMFEVNLRDERPLPFEGAGVESTWTLELPASFRQFDYSTISDVVFHVRYTAREGGAQLGTKAVERMETLLSDASTTNLRILTSLRHDFPNEWHQFVTGTGQLTLTVKREHFPYLTQGRPLAVTSVQLCRLSDGALNTAQPANLQVSDLNIQLDEQQAFQLTLNADSSVLVRRPNADVFALITYTI